MSRKVQYVCQACGYLASRWAGQCAACRTWNTLRQEECAAVGPAARGLLNSGAPSLVPVGAALDGAHADNALLSGLSEFDRVCGAHGMVPGSVLLIGGDPGVGKSTLLMQVAGAIARSGKRVVYASGEEATHQVAMRAKRLGLEGSCLALLNTNEADDLLAVLDTVDCLELAVIDSIQTMASSRLDAPVGSVNQMRFVTQELVRFSKSRGVVLIVVGHVTKEGQIAGPKLIEHMVDAVFYFEGENRGQFRVLRAAKNRFGATNEVGIFEMSGGGLSGVENVSQLLLAGHQEGAIGSTVFAGLEGARPVLIEVQTLLARSNLAIPRRVVSGVDASRLAMIIAVLEARCSLKLGQFDAYLNIAGGFRVTEPAVDLAIAASIISSYFKKPVPGRSALLGEIGLSGFIRPVSNVSARLREVEKMGLRQVILPPSGQNEYDVPDGLGVRVVTELSELVRLVHG